MTKQVLRPLNNDKGAGLIAIIIALTMAVLSYTAYTASSYVFMMTESKRQRRQLVGYEAMYQLAKVLIDARQRDADLVAGGTVDCSGHPSGDVLFKVGNFCLTATNCIQNPLDDSQNICYATATTAGSTTPTVEVSTVDVVPTFYNRYIKPIRQIHEWYGRKSYNVAKAFIEQAPIAHAVASKRYIPAMPAAVPDITFTAAAADTACVAGADPVTDNNLCMPCAENPSNATGDARAACLRLKVCIRGIDIGGATPFSCGGAAADRDQWLWQSVAVTAPLVSAP